MDFELIQPFVTAVQRVFSTMLQIDVGVAPSESRSAVEKPCEVVGVIGLSGDVTGSVALKLPLQTAESIVSLFTGQALTFEDNDFSDAVGELANMIAGNAKGEFKNVTVSITCPHVGIERDGKANQTDQTTNVLIPFVCDCGEFAVEVILEEGFAADCDHDERGTEAA